MLFWIYVGERLPCHGGIVHSSGAYRQRNSLASFLHAGYLTLAMGKFYFSLSVFVA